MNIGVLKETGRCERRVGLTPTAVRPLVERGHGVLVEHGAGNLSHFPDLDYAAAGAQIVFAPAEVIDRSDLLVKVERPTREELERLHSHQTVLAFFHLVLSAPEDVALLLEKHITAIGYEIIESQEGRLPVLEPISEIAGKMSVAVAAHLLRSTSGGRGILLGGSSGVAPARLLILGAGIVGTWAARTALNNGAHTTVLDNDASKLSRLRAALPGAITGLADRRAVAEAVRGTDVLIGAVLIHGERTPHLVSRGMVETMKPGSVILDVSIDQGGCIATSWPTTLCDPVFTQSGVLHYCVPNMTADVGHTASEALSQVNLPYILELANYGVDEGLARSPDLARGVFTLHGECTHRPLAERFHLQHWDVFSMIGQPSWS